MGDAGRAFFERIMAMPTAPLPEEEIEAGAQFLLRVWLADLERYPAAADIPGEVERGVQTREPDEGVA